MAAIDDVVQAHGTAVVAYATRLTGDDHHSAEDIVQETWLRAWRHVDSLAEDRGSVRGWLLRAPTTSRLTSIVAAVPDPPKSSCPDHEVPGAPVIPSPADAVETRVVVNSALDNLSAVYRRTLAEVYLADHTATSAASVLGVPVGTVKSRVYSGLRALRNALPQRLEAA